MEVKNKWLILNSKWGDFNNSTAPSIIIVDGVKCVVHILYPRSGLRQPSHGPFSYILRDIDNYISENSEMIKLSGSDFIFPDIIGDISDDAVVYINPRAVMRIRDNKIKIRTTFTSESVLGITNSKTYEVILDALDRIFNIYHILYKEV